MTADDEHQLRNLALRELSDADRAYRSAFAALTSRGGLDRSSYDELRASVDRLRVAAAKLVEAAPPVEPVAGRSASTAPDEAPRRGEP